MRFTTIVRGLLKQRGICTDPSLVTPYLPPLWRRRNTTLLRYEKRSSRTL